MSRQNEIEARLQKLETEVSQLQTRVTDLLQLETKVNVLSETVQEEMKSLAVNVHQEIREIKENSPSVTSILSQAAAGAALVSSPILNLVSETNPTSGKRKWILGEIFRDFRTIFLMYFDQRYRLRRSTQLLVPSILISLILVYLFFNYAFSILLISPILERLIEMILAVLLYKVLNQEMIRYREALKAYETMTAGYKGPPTT
ncbi:MAG: hypothetical protein N2112_11950 [Gemmataceae bacterium]|jgi:hypothetical protein|nr:hypothetical protein [Gemmataceae bacterium]